MGCQSAFLADEMTMRPFASGIDGLPVAGIRMELMF